jgi:hypothetical protein
VEASKRRHFVLGRRSRNGSNMAFSSHIFIKKANSQTVSHIGRELGVLFFQFLFLLIY